MAHGHPDLRLCPFVRVQLSCLRPEMRGVKKRAVLRVGLDPPNIVQALSDPRRLFCTLAQARGRGVTSRTIATVQAPATEYLTGS